MKKNLTTNSSVEKDKPEIFKFFIDVVNSSQNANLTQSELYKKAKENILKSNITIDKIPSEIWFKKSINKNNTLGLAYQKLKNKNNFSLDPSEDDFFKFHEINKIGNLNQKTQLFLYELLSLGVGPTFRNMKWMSNLSNSLSIQHSEFYEDDTVNYLYSQTGLSLLTPLDDNDLLKGFKGSYFPKIGDIAIFYSFLEERSELDESYKKNFENFEYFYDVIGSISIAEIEDLLDIKPDYFSHLTEERKLRAFNNDALYNFIIDLFNNKNKKIIINKDNLRVQIFKKMIKENSFADYFKEMTGDIMDFDYHHPGFFDQNIDLNEIFDDLVSGKTFELEKYVKDYFI